MAGGVHTFYTSWANNKYATLLLQTVTDSVQEILKHPFPSTPSSLAMRFQGALNRTTMVKALCLDLTQIAEPKRACCKSMRKMPGNDIWCFAHKKWVEYFSQRCFFSQANSNPQWPMKTNSAPMKSSSLRLPYLWVHPPSHVEWRSLLERQHLVRAPRCFFLLQKKFFATSKSWRWNIAWLQGYWMIGLNDI